MDLTFFVRILAFEYFAVLSSLLDFALHCFACPICYFFSVFFLVLNLAQDILVVVIHSYRTLIAFLHFYYFSFYAFYIFFMTLFFFPSLF